jgi:hypothetical protein
MRVRDCCAGAAGLFKKQVKRPLAKFNSDGKECQGTTLVVPEELQNHVGL